MRCARKRGLLLSIQPEVTGSRVYTHWDSLHDVVVERVSARNKALLATGAPSIAESYTD